MSRGKSPWSKPLEDGKRAVYLLCGEETFLTRQAADWLRGVVLEGAIEDFNLDRFDGRDSPDIEAIAQAARTLPMMADRRLVLVRNAEALFVFGKDALSKLLDYIAAPDPTTCLVFQAMDKVNRGSVLYKRLAKHGCVLDNKALPERELHGFVRQRAEGRGRRIDGEAAALLVEAIGRDLGALDAALERLTLFVPAPGLLDVAAVEATVPHTRARTVWELVDAVAERDVARTLERAHQLLDQGEDALRLLGLITYQFRQLLIGRSARAQGVSPQDAAQKAGVPPFRARNFLRHIENYNLRELLAALDRLSEADRALKLSKLDSGLLFESMLLDLCAPRTP
ncbi:MAG: DNA polymerase III subunit delta [Myxococcales bacterium]|nr:DNA polymerase III subunit delta [Myxococcales bacterium]